MNYEALLTGTKWDIIELLSKKPMSPSELSDKLGTTIANISQQIRLLETAGLIMKSRTGKGKPGKPRVLFSLAHDYCMIILFAKGTAKKKLVRISAQQKKTLHEIIT